MKGLKQYSDKELAEAHIFPSQLSQAEKNKSEKEFSEFSISSSFSSDFVSSFC